MIGNRILVIRGGAIGDFILTLPVLAALRKQFPGTHLEVLGYPHVAHLAVAGGLADAVRPIEARGLAGFFARGGDLEAALQDYFASFAIILSFLYDPDGVFEANVARCSRAQFIAGPHRPDDKAGIHATEVFLKPLDRLAIFDADATPRLNFAPLTSPLSVPLALHPGSGSERKNWPEANWAELLGRLVLETPLDFLLVGGEAEGGRLERLRAGSQGARIALAHGEPLEQLAARLCGCAAFVGHDSGITHLAAALGLPTLALWGETNESVWAPRGRHVKLLRASRTLAALPVADVLEGIRHLAPAGRN